MSPYNLVADSASDIIDSIRNHISLSDHFVFGGVHWRALDPNELSNESAAPQLLCKSIVFF